MGRKDTKAIKSITKMYEQLELAQDDIFHGELGGAGRGRHHYCKGFEPLR